MRIFLAILCASLATARAQILIDHYRFGSVSEENGLLTGLQVMFEANEIVGNLHDSSGAAQHMTEHGTVSDEVNGRVVRARSFSNSGYEDYFTIAANSAWNTLSNGNFTIAFWLKPGGDILTRHPQYIMGKYDASGIGSHIDWFINLVGGDDATYVGGINLKFVAQNENTDALVLDVPLYAGAVPEDEWVFVAIIRDGDDWTVTTAAESDTTIFNYVDTAAGLPGFEVANNIDTFYIGNVRDSTLPSDISDLYNFSGEIDHVGFWSVALNECQLTKLFNLRTFAQFDADENECETIPVHTAASTSRADVLAAYNETLTGEILAIPAGDSTWTSPIIITRGIIIRGAGTNSTVLRNNQNTVDGQQQGLFHINLTADDPMEITGIKFIEDDGDSFDCAGILVGRGTVHATKVRIHHCHFENFRFAYMVFSANGVIDNSTFKGNSIVGRVAGYFGSGQLLGFPAPPYAMGSSNYWVFETNRVQYVEANSWGYDFDTEFPANYMIRHSTFDVARSGSSFWQLADMHGDSTGALNDLGVVINNNTINLTGNVSGGFRLADIRGGIRSLVFENVVNGGSGGIQLRDDPLFGPLLSETYIWDNPSVTVGPVLNGITLNTHYFEAEPSGFTQLAYPHPLRE
jgi:hypothetical protein